MKPIQLQQHTQQNGAVGRRPTPQPEGDAPTMDFSLLIQQLFAGTAVTPQLSPLPQLAEKQAQELRRSEESRPVEKDRADEGVENDRSADNDEAKRTEEHDPREAASHAARSGQDEHRGDEEEVRSESEEFHGRRRTAKGDAGSTSLQSADSSASEVNDKIVQTRDPRAQRTPVAQAQTAANAVNENTKTPAETVNAGEQAGHAEKVARTIAPAAASSRSAGTATLNTMLTEQGNRFAPVPAAGTGTNQAVAAGLQQQPQHGGAERDHQLRTLRGAQAPLVERMTKSTPAVFTEQVERRLLGERVPQNLQKLAQGNQRQIVEQIRTLMDEARKNSSGNQISFRLDPPELGSVTVKLTQRADQLFARIVPESPDVETLLRDRAPELLQYLTANGVRSENIHLSIGRDSSEGVKGSWVGTNTPSFQDHHGSEHSKGGRFASSAQTGGWEATAGAEWEQPRDAGLAGWVA